MDGTSASSPPLNTDARFKIGGDKVNFFVQYDGKDESAPHVLWADAYNTSNDADYDSWLLFEKVEGDAEAMQVEPAT